MDSLRCQQLSVAGTSTHAQLRHLLLRHHQHPQNRATLLQLQSHKKLQQSSGMMPDSEPTHSSPNYHIHHYTPSFLLWKDAYIFKGIEMMNHPVKLLFQPSAIEASYQTSLKLQIAIFRSNIDDKGKRKVKMDKTDPMKYCNPGEVIHLSKELSLLTTLPYNKQTRQYEDKEVEFQMALEVDGTKSRMAKKINLKDVVNNRKQGKFSMDTPKVTLFYKMEVKLEGGEEEKPIPKTPTTPRCIKFQDDYLSTNPKQEIKENISEQLPKRHEKGRHKTMVQGIKSNQLGAQLNLNLEKEKQRRIRKSKSVTRKIEQVDEQEEDIGNLRNTDGACYQPSANYLSVNQSKKTLIGSSHSHKTTEQFQGKYNQLVTSYKQLQKKLKDRDSKIVQLSLNNQQLHKKIDSDAKSQKYIQKLVKDHAKKQQAIKAGYQSQISDLKDETKQYRIQIDKLSKVAFNYQESSKNLAVGNQSQVKTLKEKVRQLERMSYESKRQESEYETHMRDKDDIISDLKSQIYALDRDNAELKSQVKGLEGRVQRVTSDYTAQIADLQQKVGEMKVQNKNLRVPSARDLSGDKTDWKKKAETLEKQLQRKQQLLKKMTEMKKEIDGQRSNETQSMRKEIEGLKETIERLESRQGEDNSSTTSIEYRVQMERMKREMDSLRKGETKLLIDKTRLQNMTNELKDEVVKEKLKIANMLNAIGETGDQKLISQVYGCIE